MISLQVGRERLWGHQTPMLIQINSIQKLGLVFKDYAWDVGVPDFNEVNLIYGMNGSGKTTLTRLFDQIESPTDRNLTYEVTCKDGSRIKTEDTFPYPVRVFNQDYIQRNVRLLESSANSISILLGAENKQLIEEIEAIERELSGDPKKGRRGKLQEYQGYAQKKERKVKENEAAFTAIAKTIGAAMRSGGQATRTYRAPNAKSDFAALTATQMLTEEELTAATLSITQEVLDKIEGISLAKSESAGQSGDSIESVMWALQSARDICAKTAQAILLQRLAENLDISNWVELGLALHAKHKSITCEYCGNAISGHRVTELARHFSEADRLLKEQIDTALQQLRSAHDDISRTTPVDAARLYKELQRPYGNEVRTYVAVREGLLTAISGLMAELQDKKNKTGEPVELKIEIDAGPYRSSLAALNSLIEAHNAKSAGFKTIQAEAEQKVRTHYLSTIFDEVKKREGEITALETDLEQRAADIEGLRAREAEARAMISSAHKACDEINTGLTRFLGHSELCFEPLREMVDEASGGQKEQITGYRIMRGTEPAKHLSEGEKTAVAFVYFVVHLGDGQFQKDQGIVVIDDPVSSLDSNSLYQAFSFLKNAVRECMQVFICTHNFEFLRLLLNWRSKSRRKKTGLYMIRNCFDSGARKAKIVELDRELKDYESEYHYLFKLLKQLQADQDGSIMRAYPVPNIARKVWEHFLMYRIPSGNLDAYAKLDELKKLPVLDEETLDAIHKFVNDQSHITGAGFDPALVPGTKKVLSDLFDVMRKCAPDHFAILERATQ